jgi:hypothetical protein
MSKPTSPSAALAPDFPVTRGDRIVAVLYPFTGLLVGAVVGGCLGAAGMRAAGLSLEPEMFPLFAVLNPIGLVAILLGAGLGLREAHRCGGHVIAAGRRARRRRTLCAEIETVPRSSIHLATAGPRLRLVGRIIEAVPVPSVHDRLACASETLPDGSLAPAPAQSTGGVFCLDDGTGRLWVDARCVVVAEGVPIDREVCVPVGALVEVCGPAQLAATNDEDALGGAPYRAGPCQKHSTVNIAGSPVAPVIVRMLRPPA